MSSIYQFKIDSRKTDKVRAILGLSPDDGDGERGLLLEREIPDEGPWVDAIGEFLGVLEGKYDSLAEVGVERSDISIWLLYEYAEQCNMEFAPQTLLKLGKEGITLCVSCWQKAS